MNWMFNKRTSNLLDKFIIVRVDYIVGEQIETNLVCCYLAFASLFDGSPTFNDELVKIGEQQIAH